jgi:hypothetical protein
VAIFARSLSLPIDPRSLAARWAALGAAALASIAVGLLLAAVPAGAVVVTVPPAGPFLGRTVGLQAPNAESFFDGHGELGAKFANNSGSPVVHTNNTYAIYWDPQDYYHGDWQHVINTFLQGVGTESGGLGTVFSVDTQYRDKTNQGASYQSTFRGAYTDTTKYPVAGCKDPEPLKAPDAITCLSDEQVQQELESFITAHGLQKGMGTIFYLLTPPGVSVCIDSGLASSHCSTNSIESKSVNGFCSYHSAITANPTNGDANTILYAVVPWTAGGLGDYHLTQENQAPAYACQDGGFDPTSKPAIEKKEPIPTQQEPNQMKGVGPDGARDHGLADLITNQIAVEQQNTVTDPLLNAWMDTAKNEATDECRNFFAPASGSSSEVEGTLAGTLFNQTLNGVNYYLNTAFDLAAIKLPYPGVPCLPGVSIAPEFTAPNPVNAGDIVGFDGMESNITLNANTSFVGGVPHENFATYLWNFGDGSPEVSGYAPGAPVCAAPWLSPCAGSVFHAYQYGGTYNVTLTVTDVSGNKSGFTRQITVVGPPPPSPAAAATTQSTQSTQTGAGSGSTGQTPRIAPNPVATNAIVSRSLTSVLRNGLQVRYSVNEQVTGRFEVLLSRTIARHLGISGTLASGLPVGAAPSLVIAKAILVTTKAGRNTVKILFSKRTAARLRTLRKVSLTLRMVVRNASFPTPVSMTVLSVVTLSH